jgi:predicted acylesterase/phospholipase RssA
MIKHIVLSGGFYVGLQMYGVIYELQRTKYLNMDNIDSFYGTSIGSVLCLILMLTTNMENTYNYIKNRPLNIFTLSTIDDNTKGIYTKDIIIHLVRSFLYMNELTIESTLKDLYSKTNKDFYVYATKLSDMKLEEFSHKSHPNLSIIDCLYMSCSIPYLFNPLYKDGSFYVDGAIIDNYPYIYCLNRNKPDSILGIYTTHNNIDTISPDSSIIDYIIYLNKKCYFRNNGSKEYSDHENNIEILHNGITLEVLIELSNNTDTRVKYIHNGIELAREHMISKNFIF